MSETVIRDGLVVFVKRACETCVLIESEVRRLARERNDFSVVSQDDPRFPAGVAGVIDDRELDWSWKNDIESMPTLIRYQDGREAERVVGWDRAGWQRLTGIADLGVHLPVLRPG